MAIGGLSLVDSGAASVTVGEGEREGVVKTLTDMLLAMQLRVGELDCDVSKVMKWRSASMRGVVSAL